MNTKVNRKVLFFTAMLVVAFLLTTFQKATATHQAVPILAVALETHAVTRTLGMVYAEADDKSALLTVLEPGKQVKIIGVDESGDWVAIAKADQNSLAGWISKSAIEQDLVVGTTRYLVQVHQSPDSLSEVSYVLTPGENVQVLGSNPDNTWIAIVGPGSTRATVSWVKADELKVPNNIAIAKFLTMVYQRPDTTSKVTYVLSPAQKVTLLGRDNSGSWLALVTVQDERFIGWAHAGDLSSDIDLARLPIRADR
jgi:hypothetical protein